MQGSIGKVVKMVQSSMTMFLYCNWASPRVPLMPIKVVASLEWRFESSKVELGWWKGH